MLKPLSLRTAIGICIPLSSDIACEMAYRTEQSTHKSGIIRTEFATSPRPHHNYGNRVERARTGATDTLNNNTLPHTTKKTHTHTQKDVHQMQSTIIRSCTLPNPPKNTLKQAKKCKRILSNLRISNRKQYTELSEFDTSFIAGHQRPFKVY